MDMHKNLQLRMVLVGAILFGFYVAAGTAIHLMTGWNLYLVLAAGIILIPAFQYKLGKWLALRGAEDMPQDGEYRQVHQMTEKLAREMEVKKPRLMKKEMGVPNAFAVGRKGAGVVVVSEELMAVLERDELEGVIAHELAHIKNRDVVTMVIGQSIATIVGYVAYFAVLAGGQRDIRTFIVAMAASTLANMLVMVFVFAISRYREYVADADAAEAVGRGEPLARALEKISEVSQQKQAQAQARGDRGDVGADDRVRALCIFGDGEKSLIQKAFSTHPPTEKRIQRLRGY